MKARVFVAFVIGTLLVVGIPERARTEQHRRCFPNVPAITNCIEGRFLEYWEQNGGLYVFGYPISAARKERNRDTGKEYLTQWFERNRFEWHENEPENPPPYDVLLGRLGDDRLLQLNRRWQNEPRESGPAPNCLWFQQTGHNVCNQRGNLGIRTHWQTHGLEFDGRSGVSNAESLALFGLPLTAPKMETNSSGDTVLTQWFERARFEWHPDKPDRFKVLLGLLGGEVVNGVIPPPDDDQDENRRITIPKEDLERLREVLRGYGLSPDDVRTEATVTFALPAAVRDGNPIVSQNAPLAKANEKGVLGVLNVGRPLPIGDDDNMEIPRGIYVVRQEPVFEGPTRIHFVNSQGEEPVKAVNAIVRQTAEQLDKPHTFTTNNHICWTVQGNARSVQFCVPSSPRKALTPNETARLVEQEQASVGTLRRRGLIENQAIKVEDVMPAAEGRSAVEGQQASLLIAPVEEFTGAKLEESPLLGTARVLLTVEVAQTKLEPGSYAVRAQRTEQGWNLRFEGVADDDPSGQIRKVDAPAEVVEEGGSPGLSEGPFVSLESVCWRWLTSRICRPPRR